MEIRAKIVNKVINEGNTSRWLCYFYLICCFFQSLGNFLVYKKNLSFPMKNTIPILYWGRRLWLVHFQRYVSNFSFVVVKKRLWSHIHFSIRNAFLCKSIAIGVPKSQSRIRFHTFNCWFWSHLLEHFHAF